MWSESNTRKGIARPGHYEPKNAVRSHFFMVNNGEAYKQTFKG